MIPCLKARLDTASGHEDLYVEIGWNDLIYEKAYNNTYAIRMSHGLLKRDRVTRKGQV